jgi:hypothetical protein
MSIYKNMMHTLSSKWMFLLLLFLPFLGKATFQENMIFKSGFEPYICQAQDECYYVAPNASSSAACTFDDPCDLQTAKGLLSGGDVLYFLEGTYNESYLFTGGAYGDYEMILAFGRTFSFQAPIPDSYNRVKLSAYPEHQVIIDGQYNINNDTGAQCFYTDQSYVTFSGFIFHDCKTGINIGENRITADVTGTVVSNNHFTGTHFVNDNGGNVTVFADAIDTYVQNNWFDGPGANVGSMNSAGVYFTHDRHVEILHNEISNHRTGIHYKHDHSPTVGNTGTVIAYNYIHDVSIAARLNSRYAHIHDNITTANAGSFSLNHCSGATGEGGDYNTINNNYFHALDLNGCSDTNVDQGAYKNIIKDNIIATRFYVHPWVFTPHETTMNYNLYMDDIFENNVAYDLSQWQIYYGQDNNSKSGTPTFNNSNLINIADYRLMPGSLGYQADEQGNDMGPDVERVGRY